MIDISTITAEKESMRGSYFSFDAYIQGDIELGLLENRSGLRLLGVPQSLLEGIYSALNNEIGHGGSSLVLFSCGRWWGKSFYRRFAQEVGGYYGREITELKMVEFLQCLKECWQTQGWGKLEIDLDYYKKGFLVMKTHNSAFAQFSLDKTTPNCTIEAGVLSAFFSQLTKSELHGVQTECESMGAANNTFIIGLKERLEPTQTMIEQKQDHMSILNYLCNYQGAE